MLNELITELNSRGANFIKTVDISMLSEKEKREYNVAILIGIALSPEFIWGLSKRTTAVPSEFWKRNTMENGLQILSLKKGINPLLNRIEI